MVWLSSRNIWGDTCSDTSISRRFISSAETPVKLLFSRFTSTGICSASTFSCIRSSWLFTRLSPIIMTTMQLCSSTGSSSNRRAVICFLPLAAT